MTSSDAKYVMQMEMAEVYKNIYKKVESCNYENYCGKFIDVLQKVHIIFGSALVGYVSLWFCGRKAFSEKSVKHQGELKSQTGCH